MIEFKQIGKTYHINKSQTVIGLQDINFSIQKGEIFGIAGFSGAGKSTLLRIINLLEIPNSGELWIDGEKIKTDDQQQIKKIRRESGMIFQHFNLLKSKTVRENIAFPLLINQQHLSEHIVKNEINLRVDELIEQVGLTQHQHKYPSQLSGGQKQRVGIARALANYPKILLCDEATSALDPSTTQEILNLLLQINQKLGITIVLITHEMGVLKKVCDRVAVLDHGTLVELDDVQNIFLNPKHAQTKLLINEDKPDFLAEKEAYHITDHHFVAQLTTIGEQVYQPILSTIAHKYDLSYQILHGRVERIKNIPYSQLILAISGEQLAEALVELQENAVDIQAIHQRQQLLQG